MHIRGRFSPGFLAAGLFLAGPLRAQSERAPRAGEAWTETVFGKELSAAARDRASVTALVLNAQWIPDGPEQRVLVPAGGGFLWRNRRDGEERLRADIAVIANDVRYNRRLAPSGWEAALTLENVTLPFARSEYVEGRRIASEELKWNFVRTGAGIGYRRTLSPGHQDNAFEAALTYEPGYLFFARGGDTASSFLLPRETYEGRIHLRLRADALERNILELPHAGVAAGLDAVAGHRSDWTDWGGGVLGVQNAGPARDFRAVSLYAVAAGGLPLISGERHRYVASAYAGRGVHLDRFSAFRLGGGSNAGDWESLSAPVLPAAGFQEFFPSRYGIVNLEYRYQAFFFLYLQARGSLAWLDRPRLTPQGSVTDRTGSLHAMTAGVTSGFLWDSSLELDYSYNFGILRQRSGAARSGGAALFLAWTKEFRARR
jgi:hypothetical protein